MRPEWTAMDSPSATTAMLLDLCLPQAGLCSFSPEPSSLCVALVILGIWAALLLVVESLWPASRQQVRARPDLGTDVAYAALNLIVLKPVVRLSMAASILGLALASGAPADIDHIRAFLAARPVAADHPFLLQVIEVMLVSEFVGYWLHRLFHVAPLWRFHAIHHGSRNVDWLSALRTHPVNELVMRLGEGLLLFLLGFRAAAILCYLPVPALLVYLVHANVNWSFGPLRYVVASPVFHRWHHTIESEARDKNFGGVLVIYDILFGTFFMPRDRLPAALGLAEEPVPDGFCRQLAHPFIQSPAPAGRFEAAPRHR
jgi:sterol desaturase/sphingolipid hydroxylase (fatty acid hydroxylase superfamily)